VEGSLVLDTPSALPERINWMVAVDAAESKKAQDVKVLDLREVTSFTDYFVICSASSTRQGKAIADEIGKALKKIGELPVSAEGYDSGEWILLDYGDFIVHIFSETARGYYDLERLWRHARSVELPVVEKAS
jgi:ribosome-associated protein